MGIGLEFGVIFTGIFDRNPLDTIIRWHNLIFIWCLYFFSRGERLEDTAGDDSTRVSQQTKRRHKSKQPEKSTVRTMLTDYAESPREETARSVDHGNNTINDSLINKD